MDGGAGRGESKGGVLGRGGGGRWTCVLVPVRDDASINLSQLTMNELYMRLNFIRNYSLFSYDYLNRIQIYS